MAAPLQAQYIAPIDPMGFDLRHSLVEQESCPSLSSDQDYLFPNGTSASVSECSITTLDSSCAPDEEECLVDSQPMCFKENPFLVANRKGKGLPPGQRILSGPPVGYGKPGQLQPWLHSKAPSGDYTRTESPVREAPYSPTVQPANIHYTSTPTAKDNFLSSTRPGAIQPVGRVRPTTSPGTPDGHSPNPFQHGPSPFNTPTSPRAPSPTSSNEFPLNVKQAYKAFAAVPRSQAVLEPPQDLYGVRNNFHPQQPSPETPSPGGKDSPEQRSFRDRQKYFEIDVKTQTPEKPKPRVSLVGADDLKKMREEEERKFEQRAREYLMDDDDEDEEEEDLAKQVAQMKVTGKVLLDGVEYKVEPATSPSPHCATPPGYYGSSGPSSIDGKGDSQRNSLEDSFRLEQRPNSMTGLIPVYPADSAAPIRTAKAERRHQDRLRMQSPELAVAQDKDLSPAEKRALEAEKRAMWRAARPYELEEDVRQYEQDLAKRLYQARVRASQGSAAPQPPASCSSAAPQLRMKSLEQDALKAQMVIAKSRDGKKRGTLDQLTESPSPAPTPSPTPIEDVSPRSVTSPGRLSLSSKKFDYRQFAAIPSSKPVYNIQTPEAVDDMQFNDGSHNTAPVASPEADLTVPLPTTSALEEMALYSNKRKLRQGRRSLETAVPT